MDTISRENNSMLPIVGVIAGAVALLLGVYTAVKTSHIQATLTAHEEKLAKIDDLSGQVTALATSTDKANKDIATLTSQTQNAVTAIGNELGTMQASIKTLEESAKRPAASGKGVKGGGPVVAGPGEYVVVAGDSGMKIAKKNGCSLHDLEAVNPGVKWSGLHPGMKLKLPSKGGAAAPAAAPAASGAPTT